ncbi:protein HEXIM2 isoform X2 [Notamacropus eugenii]|uniref:protein HEXIM2 isoform X2 n=1 Tax=Notamacropus eugenii TaxID=9315 RepID=UPI003B676486
MQLPQRRAPNSVVPSVAAKAGSRSRKQAITPVTHTARETTIPSRHRGFTDCPPTHPRLSPRRPRALAACWSCCGSRFYAEGLAIGIADERQPRRHTAVVVRGSPWQQQARTISEKLLPRVLRERRDILPIPTPRTPGRRSLPEPVVIWRRPSSMLSFGGNPFDRKKNSGISSSSSVPPEPSDSGDCRPLTPGMDSPLEWKEPARTNNDRSGQNGTSQTESPGCDSAEALARRKHRRRSSKRKRHGWKPYLELSWAEKQQRDEQQSQRASRVREEMFAKGQAVAPYNTTQFLMDDHDLEEPDLGNPQRVPHQGPGWEDEDEEEDEGTGDIDGRGKAQGEFLQRDFSEAYEHYHVESLQGRSKEELVRDYLELEKRLSRAEEETRRLQQQRNPWGPHPCYQAQELAAEVERLKTENQRLRQENEMWGQEGSSPRENLGT